MSEAWERIRRGAVHLEVEAHLQEAVDSGRPLRVKLGIDPSSPDIHIGHAVVLNKLRDFQDAGHLAVLIIGDYTARIGDPSGRSETRKPLTPDEVDRNAETYLDQVFRVIDRDRCEIRRQSEWFGGMTLADVLVLAGKTTLAQVTQREDFSKRLKEGHALGLHELLYPLMQGYDSVAVRSDVELGGTDQLFNLLFARETQRDNGLPPQDILTTPVLEGLDGVQKMSKSLGNYVGVTDRPAEMFGKLMSVPDGLIVSYLRLVGGVGEAEVERVQAALESGQNPRDLKAGMARAIVSRFHDPDAGAEAEEEFEARFRRKEVTETREAWLPPGIHGASVVATLTALGLAKSNGEARRLVEQRGVRVNGATVEDPFQIYDAADGDLWQVGKQTPLRIKLG